MTLDEIRSLIRDVPDFPKPGILFKDITPLLANASAFVATIEHLAEQTNAANADAILAIESRGFIFGAGLATRLKLPLQLVRKQGKLPREVISQAYSLEYGIDHVEVHADVIERGGRYLIVDDLIATGGTAAAVVQLVQQGRAEVAACAFVIELKFLNGRERLGAHPVRTLISY
jgi:adenine phosphoribosyltransferase